MEDADNVLRQLGMAVRRKPAPATATRPLQHPPANVREPLLEGREPSATVEEVPTSHESMPWYQDASAFQPQVRKMDTETDESSVEPKLSPPERPPGRSRKLMALSWAVEFFWCLVSIVLLAALAMILAIHNGKPLPRWPLGLTLNTVVALLATFCRASFVVAVTEGVSQLKWNWFAEKPRPLNDLEIFDQASRGPWGSIRSLFGSRWR